MNTTLSIGTINVQPIVDLMVRCGFEVIFKDHPGRKIDDRTVVGETFYDKRKVIIYEWGSYRTRAQAVLHEAGHVLHFTYAVDKKCFRHPTEKNLRHCELRAYYYGWALIVHYNLPLTRYQWRLLHHHTEALEQVIAKPLKIILKTLIEQHGTTKL